ncbi:SWIM zinc finger family protein [Paucibacter sp. R3-3]|uniref:SWIM zinc finger family protein n=1 Tax=Roseateles agri TaxID=3098619 RepID=A0ABU5DHJ9_9BURK|nr:SWIM zinc finger family protein [Paucibacter sp. R3-3]MDY0745759.1 SWIM zinc finger family protein [Paucibacter sp. R3-3]
MSSLRTQLQEQLARFDDDGLAALANRGLLRRAQKDLERVTVEIMEEGADHLVVAVGPQRVRFDARGPAQARCDCPANDVCQHILAAIIGLQRLGGAPPPAASDAAQSAADDPLATLRESLLAVSMAELVKHAGKPGYRWAWQYVQDLDDTQALQIGGERHLVLQLQRPRLTLRYMGGALANLIVDTEIAQVEKYRVAAVLAFQRAHGREPAPLEPAEAPRAQALDLGVDHQLAAPSGAALDDSRRRLREAVRQLLADAVGLGLAHLSEGMHERFTTLAVWAQGAEFHRLALLLRRIADHIELLLQRAGGADEHRLFDELSLAQALVDALGVAAVRGLAPVHLVGRARTRYEETGTLELLGLGARAWRSASGYVGLTMMFWSPREGFMSCTDARPESLRGFDAIARYKAAGPWSGLGAPHQATGRRLALVGAQLNEAMRLSARDSTAAIVLQADRADRADGAAWSAEQLKPWTRWAELTQARSAGRSLLARPAPMQDWVFLQPGRFGPSQFDETRQTLLWPLCDADGQILMAELAFDRYTEHAMERIEALPAGPNSDALILVAQLRNHGTRLVADPLSLICSGAAMPVDALYFDGEPTGEGLLARWRKAWSARAAVAPAPSMVTAPPAALAEARRSLQRFAERGLPVDAPQAWKSEQEHLLEQTRVAGLTAFAAIGTSVREEERLLRMNYICMEYEALTGHAAESLE